MQKIHGFASRTRISCSFNVIVFILNVHKASSQTQTTYKLCNLNPQFPSTCVVLSPCVMPVTRIACTNCSKFSLICQHSRPKLQWLLTVHSDAGCIYWAFLASIHDKLNVCNSCGKFMENQTVWLAWHHFECTNSCAAHSNWFCMFRHLIFEELDGSKDSLDCVVGLLTPAETM